MPFSETRIGQRNLLQSSSQLKQVMHSLAEARGQQISFKCKMKISRSLTKGLARAKFQIKREGWGFKYYIWPGEGGMKIELHASKSPQPTKFSFSISLYFPRLFVLDMLPGVTSKL